jgi:hypothetical protein
LKNFSRQDAKSAKEEQEQGNKVRELKPRELVKWSPRTLLTPICYSLPLSFLGALGALGVLAADRFSSS